MAWSFPYSHTGKGARRRSAFWALAACTSTTSMTGRAHQIDRSHDRRGNIRVHESPVTTGVVAFDSGVVRTRVRAAQPDSSRSPIFGTVKRASRRHQSRDPAKSLMKYGMIQFRCTPMAELPAPEYPSPSQPDDVNSLHGDMFNPQRWRPTPTSTPIRSAAPLALSRQVR